jgi:hypothetical protein
MLDHVEEEMLIVLGETAIMKIFEAKYWITVQNIRVNRCKKLTVIWK